MASMAAQMEGIPGAHIEAGFRSGSVWSPFPEELARTWTDNRSTMCFAPSERAYENLFGKPGKLVLSGSTVWDNVSALRLATRRKGYAVMTAHRYENILIRSRLKRLVYIAGSTGWPPVWPMHEMTRKRVKDMGIWPNARIVDLMPYPEFMELVAGADYVITDGGGLEEEAAILRKRCILLRDRTERPEVGSVLVGLDYKKALKAMSDARDATEDLPPVGHPYFFGRSPSEIIAEYLG
jgi:UDP-N-acetylglucosamine 2-epimerase (non-hydrolysing)